jgi:UDP-2-acetamido-2,6-beta-L-arabino-hexul-4-ose reductase
MKKVLITGSKGFIGKNFLTNLRFFDGFEPVHFDLDNNRLYLENVLKEVDFVFHLAGVNRPENVKDFIHGNVELTQFIVDSLTEHQHLIPIILTSSTQAELDNPYGRSKREAEIILESYVNNGGQSYIYRLPNVFGKWCRPNYNSAVATFCHNIANGLEIIVSDREKMMELVHVDDIIIDFKKILLKQKPARSNTILSVKPSYKVALGRIADLIVSFNTMSKSGLVPDLKNDFIRKLHSTYLSYVPLKNAISPVEMISDDRGYIFELIKSKSFGQIFVSKTKPGITRGNHFHHLKNERFCVVEGTATIKVRHLITNETYNYNVSGLNPEVVDILPGYTHSIANTGSTELITLFWANEPFDEEKPDTYFERV